MKAHAKFIDGKPWRITFDREAQAVVVRQLRTKPQYVLSFHQLVDMATGQERLLDVPAALPEPKPKPVPAPAVQPEPEPMLL